MKTFWQTLKQRPERLLYLSVFVFHWCTSWFLPNLAWPDEIYQTLEQAHRLAFGYGTIPWEFREGVRNHLVPALLAVWMKLWGSLLPGSSAPYMSATTALLSYFSLAPVWVASAWARIENHRQPWLAGLLVGVWFELVFFSSKALSEVLAGYAVCVAFLFLRQARSQNTSRVLFGVGIFLALTLGLRIQMLPLVCILALYVLYRHRKQAVPTVLAFIGTLMIFGAADAVAWGTPFMSYWNYFRVNFFEGKASSFGESPWYEYMASLHQVWGVAGVLLLALWAYARRQGLALWLGGFVILVSHSFISHKEYRFLAPMLMLWVILAALAVSQLMTRHRNAGIIVCIAWLTVSAHRAHEYNWGDIAPRTPSLAHASMWTTRGGEMELYQQLSRDPSVCGVGLWGIHWAWSPGYTWLHHKIPIVMAGNPHSRDSSSHLFNVGIGPESMGHWTRGYTKGPCKGGFCIFKRDGDCRNPTHYDFNVWLEQRNM